MWERPWKQTRSDGSLLYAAVMIIMVAHINHHQPVVCHAMLCKSSTPHKPAHNISMYYLLASIGLNYYCVTRAPLLFLRGWVALYFKVCLSVCLLGIRHTWPNLHFFQFVKTYMPYTDPIAMVPSRIKQCRLIMIQYHQAPTIAVLYWPSTQLPHPVTHSWANWI